MPHSDLPDPTTTTVNAVIASFPSALPVFSSFGIDSCCGGALSVAEAARRHRVPLETLLSALEAAIAPQRASA